MYTANYAVIMGLYHNIYPVVNSIVKYFIDEFELKYKIRDAGTYLREVISILIIFIVVILMGPFVILRTVLDVILRCWHGKNYIGMLSGVDRTFARNPASVFLNVYILENKGSVAELYENVKKACEKLHCSHVKFSSITKQTFGYHYSVANKINFEEIVSVANVNQDFITQEDLSSLIDKKYSNKPQLILESKLWEVTIIDKPIIYNKQSESKTYYVMIVKTIHTMTDAIFLSAFHQKFLFDECDNRQFIKALQNTKSEQASNVRNVVKYFTKSVQPCRLNGKSMKTISSVCIEENPALFNMITEIRKAYKVTFSQVIYTASICSIYEYLKKKDTSVNDFLFGYTLRPVNEDINEIMKGKRLTNDLTFLTQVFRYPVDGQTIKDKLFDVARNLNEQKNSTDSQVMYVLQKLASYLPFPVQNFLMEMLLQPVTVGFTNIPAIDRASINGSEIKDGFVYLNSYQNTKFVFQIYTYNGRFQVNLTAMKNMVDSRKDVDDILKGTFQNIEELYKGIDDEHS